MLFRASLTMALVVLATAGAQTAATTRSIAAADLARRDPEMHWPKQFNPATAAQFSHNELVIAAPCKRVFARMADVEDWPSWFILVKHVTVDGPDRKPGPGRTLSLSIFNTPITAKLVEWVPNERISWQPQTVAPSGSSHYHVWHFVPVQEGCKVVTEEVGVGPADKKLGSEGSFYMHRAHDLWLASLRYTSE